MTHERELKFEHLDRYFFDHATAEKFIDFLKTRAEVIAPHRKGENSFSFEKVTDSSEVVFDYPRTIQPLKKYFLPPGEVLLTYNAGSNEFKPESIAAQNLIFFAVHSYELQAIKRLDYSFVKGNPESNYLQRRKNSLFIGISFTPDEWHFSKSVGIEIEKLDGFCLFFEPVENGYLVFAVDEDGKELLSEFGAGVTVDTSLNLEIKEKKFLTKITYHYNRIPQVFEHVYNSKVWDDVAKKCVGCGTCNLLCPTCYCFDVRDEVDLSLQDGQRQRFWDGCMLNTFALVAGGENFRPKLNSRTRHRLFRKFKYITQSSGELHCVGCGRCSKYCPAHISIIEIINALIEDSVAQQKKQVV
jgi:sulfhydrogenase subunit beta (sulfur reductase)